MATSTQQMSPREFLAFTFLKGQGIEIGALHEPLKTPESAQVQYVDFLDNEQQLKHFPELVKQNCQFVPVDIVDDAENLSTIADFSQDFVIANHLIEHMEDPIKALQNMLRVLKNEGILYLAVPDKRHTFDKNRSLTTFDHLLTDHREGPEGSRQEHYEDWAKHINHCQTDDEISQRAQYLMELDYRIHFHVWTEVEFTEFLSQCRCQLGMSFDFVVVWNRGNEVIYVLKK